MALTVPQIDFILEMQSIDDPEHWSFSRPNKTVKVPNALASWHDILEGGALARFLGPMLNSAVLKMRRKEKQDAQGFGLKKGAAFKNGWTPSNRK